jgi:hypothetical protein
VRADRPLYAEKLGRPLSLTTLERVIREDYEPVLRAQLRADGPVLRALAASYTPKRRPWWRRILPRVIR